MQDRCCISVLSDLTLLVLATVGGTEKPPKREEEYGSGFRVQGLGLLGLGFRVPQPGVGGVV